MILWVICNVQNRLQDINLFCFHVSVQAEWIVETSHGTEKFLGDISDGDAQHRCVVSICYGM